MNNSNMRVAIVHDWLYGGGAERVVLELHRMYPEAPIYTSYCTEEWQKRLDDNVITGYLNRWPFNRLRKYIPFLRVWWFRSLDLSDFDLIISSTGNGEAKHLKLVDSKQGLVTRKFKNRAGNKTPTTNHQPPTTHPRHICYTHTPVHFYWRHYDAYIRNPGFGFFNPLARIGLKLLVRPLRRMDYNAAQTVDVFVANSSHIQHDIQLYYGRESVVVHPPIDTDRFKDIRATKEDYFVTVGRLVPSKKTDIVVQACNQLGVKLTVVGRGPELTNLKKIAGPTITFDTSASDAAVVAYMAKAQAFLFASYDDFGITPVEAIAAGTPVIAYKAGGALDYIDEGKTGLFFDEQTVDSLCSTIESFDASKFSSKTLRKSAEQFSAGQFRDRITRLVKSHEN